MNKHENCPITMYDRAVSEMALQDAREALRRRTAPRGDVMYGAYSLKVKAGNS